MKHKITKWMAGGSIATAFVGSCCALPLLLLSLGVGGMGFATALVPYRPYFIAFTVLLLGTSFYLVYFKKTPSCDDDALCSIKSQKLTKIMLWVATGLVLLFLIGPDLIAGQDASELPGQHEVNAATECNLKIEGMSCSVCTAKIKNGLKDLILSSDIDVGAGTGKFTYAEGKTSCKELAEKISDFGFKVSLK